MKLNKLLIKIWKLRIWKKKATSTITPKINYRQVCREEKSCWEKYTGSRVVVGSCMRTYFPDIQSTEVILKEKSWWCTWHVANQNRKKKKNGRIEEKKRS